MVIVWDAPENQPCLSDSPYPGEERPSQWGNTFCWLAFSDNHQLPTAGYQVRRILF